MKPYLQSSSAEQQLIATNNSFLKDFPSFGNMDRRREQEEENPFLMTGIKYPNQNDVMLGRGGESTYHCGNIAFRQLVEDLKHKYYHAARADKGRVVEEVVRRWRTLSPPGRFLTRTSPDAGDESPWHDVGDLRARRKASHSLRDAVRCLSKLDKARRHSDDDGGKMAASAAIVASLDLKHDRDEDDEVEPVVSNSQGEMPPLGIAMRPHKMRRVDDFESETRRESSSNTILLKPEAWGSSKPAGFNMFMGALASMSKKKDSPKTPSKPLLIPMQLPGALDFPSDQAKLTLSRLEAQREELCASPCGSEDWAFDNEEVPTAAALVDQMNEPQQLDDSWFLRQNNNDDKAGQPAFFQQSYSNMWSLQRDQEIKTPFSSMGDSSSEQFYSNSEERE